MPLVGFILAAGRGERMKPLTDVTPKPLLDVAGKPLIVHQLDKLRDAGVKDIIVNTAYKAEAIERLLGSGEQYGVNIQYSKEHVALETGGALLKAMPLIAQRKVVLINADIWIDYPVTRLIDVAAKLKECESHLVLVRNPPEKGGLGDFSLHDSSVRVRQDGEAGFTFSGVSLISSELIARYPTTLERFPLREVFAWAIENRYLTGEVFEGTWMDIGTPDRLESLRERLKP